MFAGNKITIQRLESGIVELSFDARNASVNTFNTETLSELKQALKKLSDSPDISGCLITSMKPTFIVGADIAEFSECFTRSPVELKQWLMATHELFSTLENLQYPTVSAINGMALGGGFELALATDFRVLAEDARVGLPEVNLGICPGWGGTVRLSRLIGVEAALPWMLQGKPQKAAAAFQAGAVDRVVPAGELRQAALELLGQAISGELCYTKKSMRKQEPENNCLTPNSGLTAIIENQNRRLDPDYPAAGAILNMVIQHAGLPFQQALDVEAECFVGLAQSETAKSLIGLFFNDQLLKKKARDWCEKAEPVKQAAVLGAGIMGGGVAFQSASTGTPILMKDIRDEALELGTKTAEKLLDKRIEKGRLDITGKERVMDAIHPTLNYSDFAAVDLVVEAVVENPDIKAAVLSEVESSVAESAVVASNTSTISIDLLAQNVKRPEMLCGMHFFNPVHLMPLVEVIRGSKTSDKAISRTVAYAMSMGKTPIVVNDCPGFLVNRILFPYFNGFNRLLLDGVDFQRIDQVMEQFGWPMGPAYLADVVGIDTMVHADQVLQAGFPQRMKHAGTVIMEELLAEGCLGQKSDRGFYAYGVSDSGRRYREPTALAKDLTVIHRQDNVQVSDQDIIDRMMIPLCLEAVRCLEDGIVDTAAEVDMGLIMGLGFPRFRGGALRYIQSVGLGEFCSRADRYSQYGALYEVTEGLRERMANARMFYS
ncbi:fatty acid oxidation complex subunit alpha FadB [Amphritea sp. 1_MG-2023]|uniref:fatty acid oxidation complex subunit alpha FadB n=1 Tax=Amphritea sp. 1_MG-2023 TaxID=3062670 RepID=UPI0026E2046C|nr:fatty acid oxidation complex subunit alpha FadB [Amphritea sp. 1_MG-2023]MDO6565267.1 fatty acid oxidation complex subunit alpha FadB [Amphritea sp. 1_MG-2023]